MRETTPPVLPFDRPDPMAPPPAYARLRERTPVAPVITPDGRRAWLATSYDAVAQALSDRRYGLAPPGAETAANDTLFQDGEAHARLRRLVSKAFGPRGVGALRPRVERLADDHVAALAEGGPPADLVSGLAAPLSITVIGELLGVAIGDRERFRDLADAAGAADFFFGAEEDLAAAAEAWSRLTAYAGELVAAKREAPGDDLLSALVTVRDAEDGRLSDAELVAMTTTIVAAGYQTASNAISTGAIRLLVEGRLPALASSGGEEIGAVVEEILRMQAGRTGEPFPRYAQEELELAGVRIGAGDMVLVRLEAAHRDPAHFADPDRFWPERRSSPSLVFGHGMHYCLGAPLARVELAAALGALARRLPGLKLRGAVEEIEWFGGGNDTGPKAVHVAW
ncbi:cytochrome P450 [Nonomuraea sp. SYSU D8015]|uniref:cytochrome P450 n=1 Tax=Nonomuraea sp. SYSU D8015 TaxID=2593644 RepID=UPI0016615CD2|nr:cytochrome P450 [Nonomuraea sp. SYSU D8015]